MTMESTRARSGQRENQMLDEELSYKVIGCAQAVHRVLGPGFPESVYHKALCYELVSTGLPFESEKAADVFYDGKLCGEFRMDILVDGCLVLELKALTALNGEHMAQVLSYLKATGLRTGLLMNFGTKSLDVKRVSL